MAKGNQRVAKYHEHFTFRTTAGNFDANSNRKTNIKKSSSRADDMKGSHFDGIN